MSSLIPHSPRSTASGAGTQPQSYKAYLRLRISGPTAAADLDLESTLGRPSRLNSGLSSVDGSGRKIIYTPQQLRGLLEHGYEVSPMGSRVPSMTSTVPAGIAHERDHSFSNHQAGATFCINDQTRTRGVAAAGHARSQGACTFELNSLQAHQLVEDLRGCNPPSRYCSGTMIDRLMNLDLDLPPRQVSDGVQC